MGIQWGGSSDIYGLKQSLAKAKYNILTLLSPWNQPTYSHRITLFLSRSL